MDLMKEKLDKFPDNYRRNYIGDGVYAVNDGFGVWLLTERYGTIHEIYLEPAQLQNLNTFIERKPE